MIYLNNPDYYHHIEATTNKKLKVQLYRTVTAVGSTLGMAAFYRDMHDFTRRYMPNATVIQWSMPVYSKAHREEWRRKLPQDPTLLVILDSLWLQLDQAEQTERNVLSAAKAQGKQYPEIRLFKDIPRIGFISVATVSAILETALLCLHSTWTPIRLLFTY